MAALYVRLVAGVVLLAFVGLCWVLALQLAKTSRDEGDPERLARPVRVIKRRLLIKAAIAASVIVSARVTMQHINRLGGLDGLPGANEIDKLIWLSTYSYAAIAGLLVLDQVLDIIARRQHVDAERAVSTIQKRATDPCPGSTRD